MKYLGLLLIVLVSAGCSKLNAPVVYKEVLIPIKCDVPKRERPQGGPISKYVPELLIYTELLEKDLAFCRGENKN